MLLDLLAGAVDLGVVGDHPLGEQGVPVEEGLGGAGDRGTDESRHRDQVVPDPVELVGIGITHAVTVSTPGEALGSKRERAVNGPGRRVETRHLRRKGR